MSWMITDQSSLTGTCYIEVLPGKFRGECWNTSSVYFREEHFGIFEPTIMRHCPKHDHYSFTDIGKPIWEKILIDLQRIHQQCSETLQLSEIRDDVSLYFFTSNSRNTDSESETMRSLKQTLNEFIRWTRLKLENHQTIAVLGM